MDISVFFCGTGLRIEDCHVFGSSINDTNLLQIGFPGFPADDVILRKSTFISPIENNVQFDCLFVTCSSGVLLEDVIIDLQARGGELAPNVGGLHFIDSSASIIKNTIIRNQNDNGLLLEGSSGILTDNCAISDALVGGVHLFGTQACAVKNSLIANNNEGVILNPGRG